MLNPSNPSDVIFFLKFKYCSLLSVSVESLLAAAVMLLLTIFSKTIKGDYRVFVANLFVVDLFSAFVWLIIYLRCGLCGF